MFPQLPQSSVMRNGENSKNNAALKPSVVKSTPPAACTFLCVGVKDVFSQCGLETSCIRISWHGWLKMQMLLGLDWAQTCTFSGYISWDYFTR